VEATGIQEAQGQRFAGPAGRDGKPAPHTESPLTQENIMPRKDIIVRAQTIRQLIVAREDYMNARRGDRRPNAKPTERMTRTRWDALRYLARGGCALQSMIRDRFTMNRQNASRCVAIMVQHGYVIVSDGSDPLVTVTPKGRDALEEYERKGDRDGDEATS
jgi:DNA-binding MarR family transcriptional regulator